MAWVNVRVWLVRCQGEVRDMVSIMVRLRLWSTSTSLACSHFSCPYFSSRLPIGKGKSFYQIGRIKAPDPWNDQNIKDVIWGTYTQIPS